MYVLKNAFGMIRVFDDLETALDAYEDACDFCEFTSLYNTKSGEVIAESF